MSDAIKTTTATASATSTATTTASSYFDSTRRVTFGTMATDDTLDERTHLLLELWAINVADK